jgi:hypothetical protein
VRHLLQAGGEPVGQQHQIVTQFTRGGGEGAIGQDRGPGEVIGEADAADRGGIDGAEPGLIDDPAHRRIMFDQGDLAGDLEGLGRDRAARVEPEHARDRIEAAQANAITLALPGARFTVCANHHPHPVAALDVIGQRLEADAAAP